MPLNCSKFLYMLSRYVGMYVYIYTYIYIYIYDPRSAGPHPLPPSLPLCVRCSSGLGLLGVTPTLWFGMVRGLGLLSVPPPPVIGCGSQFGSPWLFRNHHHHHHHHVLFLGRLPQEAGLTGTQSWRQVLFQYPNGRCRSENTWHGLSNFLGR